MKKMLRNTGLAYLYFLSQKVIGFLGTGFHLLPTDKFCIASSKSAFIKTLGGGEKENRNIIVNSNPKTKFKCLGYSNGPSKNNKCKFFLIK